VNLQNHMSVHTGEMSYKCSLCDKSFSNSSTLCRHKDRLHSIVLRREDVKPYARSECPSQVHAVAALKSHPTVHSDFKQFCCGKCGKYFKYQNDVIQHFEKCTDDRLGIISLFKPRVSE